jgi:hypothetical protein
MYECVTLARMSSEAVGDSRSTSPYINQAFRSRCAAVAHIWCGAENRTPMKAYKTLRLGVRRLRYNFQTKRPVFRSAAKKLSTLKHLPFLPSLIALPVKESGAIAAAHIPHREAFNALVAICGTSFRIHSLDPRRLDPKVRHHPLLNANSKEHHECGKSCVESCHQIHTLFFRATIDNKLGVFLDA